MIATKQKTIRVGVDGGDFFYQDEVKSGIQRLVKSFVYSLRQLPRDGNTWLYYSFGSIPSYLRDNLLINRKLPKRLFSSLFLPLRLLRDHVYVYLGFSGVLPQFVRVFGKKSVIFIHDFGFYTNPQYYGNPEKMMWQTEYALFGADRIVVFSDYIKNQLHTRFPQIPKDKVIRIYPGCDHIREIGKIKPLKEKYFLYVGVIKAAKNIETLIKRFSKYIKMPDGKKTKLILIGPKETKYYQEIIRGQAYRSIQNNIIFLDNVTDKELNSYYSHCLGLLNVSHEEGFCYPVIEALQLKRNVIVNDIPLYQEFIPFYKTLKITKSEHEFLDAMKNAERAFIPPSVIDTAPYTWLDFALKVRKIINGFVL